MQHVAYVVCHASISEHRKANPAAYSLFVLVACLGSQISELTYSSLRDLQFVEERFSFD